MASCAGQGMIVTRESEMMLDEVFTDFGTLQAAAAGLLELHPYFAGGACALSRRVTTGSLTVQ
jgi:hypothetical protein